MITNNLVSSAEKTYQNDVSVLTFRNPRSRLAKSRNDRSAASFTTGGMLSSVQPLPNRAVLLGRCNDGLPCLMTLTDPEIGAILIGGDAGCGKTHHLQVIVDSLLRTSAPHDMQIMILTHHPEEWLGWR